MLKIRLQRIGRRNEPHFRVVVTDAKNGPKSGRFIEVLGSYNPKLGNVDLKKDRVSHWLENGAQPSDTVHNFLVDAKIIDGKKINVLPQKSPVKKEGEEEETPAATEAPAEVPAKEEAAPADDAASAAEEAPATEEAPAEEQAESTEDAAPKAEEEKKDDAAA